MNACSRYKSGCGQTYVGNADQMQHNNARILLLNILSILGEITQHSMDLIKGYITIKYEIKTKHYKLQYMTSRLYEGFKNICTSKIEFPRLPL